MNEKITFFVLFMMRLGFVMAFVVFTVAVAPLCYCRRFDEKSVILYVCVIVRNSAQSDMLRRYYISCFMPLSNATTTTSGKDGGWWLSSC